MTLAMTPTESAKWRALYEKLRVTDYGTLLTYEELDPYCGGDARANRWVISRADRELQNHDSRALGVERGVGYRVIHPEEHLTKANRHRLRSRRQARSAVRVLDAADLSLIQDAETRQAIESLSAHMGWIEQRLRYAERRQQKYERLFHEEVETRSNVDLTHQAHLAEVERRQVLLETELKEQQLAERVAALEAAVLATGTGEG